MVFIKILSMILLFYPFCYGMRMAADLPFWAFLPSFVLILFIYIFTGMCIFDTEEVKKSLVKK